jgi:ABC-type nitrate/sulfonate/bicarbonate transport system permease component
MRINWRVVQNWIVPVVVLAAWQLFGGAAMLPRYLSTPNAIVEGLWEMAATGEVLAAVAASL